MKHKSPVSLGPGVPAEFVQHFGPQCKAAICGWDRLRLRGTLRCLFSPQRMRGSLSCLGILLKDFGKFAQDLSTQVREAAVGSAAAAGRPYRYLTSAGVNKLELARQLAEQGGIQEGLIGVFAVVEPCMATTVRVDRESGLLDRQHRIGWEKRLNHLLDQAHPLHRKITTPLPGLSYYWSVVESEYATDVIFAEPAALERVYPRLLQHGLSTFGSADIMRFLGHVVPAQTGRVNGRFKAELNSSYRHRPEGVRLKHRVGHNTLKMYDKQGQVLRVETTLNAPEVFKVWRAAAGRKRKRRRRPRC